MTKQEFNGLSTEEKKAAKKNLIDTIKTTTTDDNVVNALKVLCPGWFKERVAKDGILPKWKQFSNFFTTKGQEVDELDIFTEMKVGRAEIRLLIKEEVQKEENDATKWISFNSETGIYTCLKIGENAPKEYTGPVKIVKEEVNLI